VQLAELCELQACNKPSPKLSSSSTRVRVSIDFSIVLVWGTLEFCAFVFHPLFVRLDPSIGTALLAKTYANPIYCIAGFSLLIKPVFARPRHLW
jgi:hypothetical protein